MNLREALIQVPIQAGRAVRHAAAHSKLLRVPIVVSDGQGGVREIPPDEIPDAWVEEFLQAVQERGKKQG